MKTGISVQLRPTILALLDYFGENRLYIWLYLEAKFSTFLKKYTFFSNFSIFLRLLFRLKEKILSCPHYARNLSVYCVLIT